MKPTILFLDNTCPKPYSYGALLGSGGTEQTVTKIAHALSNTNNFSVLVEQHNREVSETIEGVSYCVKEGVSDAKYVICLRDPDTVYKARVRFPKAKIYLWSHDLPTPQLGCAVELLTACKIEANLCVSNWHKFQTIEMLKPGGYTGQFKCSVIYNPINDDLNPKEIAYDPYKLIWTSSPHKGLDLALKIFNNLLSFDNNFKLFVANPGYLLAETKGSNVVPLGVVEHAEIIDHVRTSLCLFYPNATFPETFGLVFAETNAVGTPVLTHELGAAREVLDEHPKQIVDCRDPKQVIERVLSWSRGERPTVRGKAQFRLRNVIAEWLRLL